MRNSLWRVTAEPVRAEAPALAGSGLLSLLGIAANLARPWPLALAIDYAIDARPIDPQAFGGLLGPLAELPGEFLLVFAGAATVAISVVSSRLDTAAGRAGERAAERIGARLRADVFARSLGLSLRWHGRIRSGELVSRLTSDVGRLLDAIVTATITLVPDLIALVAVLALLLVLDPGLAGVGLVVVPVLALLSIRQRRVVRSTQTAARAAAGRLSGTTADLVRNVSAVQAFGGADRAAGVFARRNADLLRVELQAVDAEARWAPRSNLVLAIGAGLVLVIGGLQVRNGLQSTGHLLVVLAYLAELYAPVRSLTRLSVVLAKAGASADRIAEILFQAESIPEAPHARPLVGPVSRLQFRKVTFGYDADRPVLADFHLELRRGETVCLYGPSGIGKSTLLALLLRLWDVDGGQILVDGIDVRDYQLRSLREGIAYVPQDPWLLDATLAQNIAFGSRTATRAGVEAAARSTGVEEFARHLPLGYDEPVGEGAGRLSGGQRRRVALARAAVSSASVLLLDEPTAALDPVSAERVIAAVRAASRDRTTVIVTHDPQLAEIASRVVVLDPAPASMSGGR